MVTSNACRQINDTFRPDEGNEQARAPNGRRFWRGLSANARLLEHLFDVRKTQISVPPALIFLQNAQLMRRAGIAFGRIFFRKIVILGVDNPLATLGGRSRGLRTITRPRPRQSRASSVESRHHSHCTWGTPCPARRSHSRSRPPKACADEPHKPSGSQNSGCN